MKKTMLLLGALMLTAVAGYAQESRQDVSISATGAFAPEVHGNAVQKNTTATLGFVASYRYMLTPRSALELNYGYAQNTQKYIVFGKSSGGIHTLQSEYSAAYVYSLNFGKFNPFAEAGVGAIAFHPLKDNGTFQIDAKQNMNIGALFGAGLAYEISPSFDIRAEYRGFLVKTPDFGLPGNIFKTNRYEVISSPSIGIAYHF
ncbi:MAG: outer membrane beta-barrel protein [Edaphobacter sp.]